MVSFQCERCNDVLTKKKLDAHLNRCWDTSFTCLDCHTQFWGQDYKSHTSCISEAQKYQGALYKEKKPKPMQTLQPPTPSDPRTPYQAYVKDAEDELSPQRTRLVEINVPPPAPTPPPTAATPVNVFDFLVADGSASPSASSSASGLGSHGDDSDVSMSPEAGRSPMSSGPPSSRGHSPNGINHSGPFFSYGSGPIEVSDQRFDSEYDINMQLQRVAVPPPAPTPPSAVTQTPAALHMSDYSAERLNDSRSDKKRKRPQVEELDTSRATNARTGLHSGLTGGLTRLLSSKDRQAEASPLSPKKRSKRSNTNDEASQRTKNKEEDRTRRRKERKDKEKRRSNGVDKEDRRVRRREPKLLEGRKDLKAIEYHSTSKAQLPEQCNSDYFLSLIDKDHRSLKGQSIWGVMKMFHEGRGAAGSMETDDEEAKQNEERRLFKGLRVKIAKNGDIVLFARPEAEADG